MRYFAVLIVAALSFVSSTAEAHTLARDGNIGAVLHVAPNDDPVAKEPATIGFSVSDRDKKFDANKCDCELVIRTGATTLATLPLNDNVSTRYIFPSTGLYSLILNGRSTDSSFSTFSIEQSIRVSQTGGETSGSAANRVLSSMFLGVALISAAIGTRIFYLRNRRS